MAEPAPAPAQAQAQAAAAATPTPTPTPKPPKPPNPVFKMMGLPNLPRKLPSRNWLIFWGITGSFTAAIVYDKRETRRATAKWRRAVASIATEPITHASQLPRKMTIYLEAPPGDGLRVAQDHFIEYAKPVLAASGLDWEFVQGREEGDIRAAVAEKIRRTRRAHERPGEESAPTDETALQDLRKKMGLAEYEGIKGDILVGRHTWKEYIRGLHEGWLGSLDAPVQPEVEVKPVVEDAAAQIELKPVVEDAAAQGELKPAVEGAATEGETKDEPAEEKKPEKKPERPPQPPPYNSPSDYSSAALPAQAPEDFSPVIPIEFPHRLGFRHTFVRVGRFLNRRKLADNIGREVAAACLAASREFREADGQFEQQLVLQSEESDWPKSVWKKAEAPAEDAADADRIVAQKQEREKMWTSAMVLDPRIAQRMRRFEVQADDEARVAQIVIPEEEVEGWLKGGLRSVWRWGASSFKSEPMGPNVGNVDDE